jgi:hypothetical protein
LFGVVSSYGFPVGGGGGGGINYDEGTDTVVL